MPEIELTESQLTAIDEIRADLEAAYVDRYGHVRTEDVLNYLLDTYTPPDEQGASRQYDLIADAEYPELQRVAAEVPGVPGSGIDADEMRGRLLSELGAEELAGRIGRDTAPAEPADGESERTSTAAGETEIGDEHDDSEPDRASVPGPTDTDDASADVTGDSNGQSDGPSATSAGGILASANELLEDHDDKWQKDGSNDEPFSVTLPDGTTESVRTRDDVRKLLFQHY